MEIGTPEAQTQIASVGRSKAPKAEIGAPTPTSERGKHPSQPTKKRMPASIRLSSIIVGVVVAVVAALSIWYLVRPQPLLVQGEGDGQLGSDQRAGDTIQQ